MSARDIQESLIDGAVRTSCLNIIYRLKINDILNNSKVPLTAEEICQKVDGCTLDASYLQRVMRYLSCFGVFKEKQDDKVLKFETTDVLKLPETPVVFHNMTVSVHLMEALVGKTNNKSLFEHVHEKTLWQHMSQNDEYKSTFQKYMVTLSREVAADVSKIVEEIIREGMENATIVDVGGMHGQMLELLSKHLSSLNCINFDLPFVIEQATPKPNVKMVSGDMFKVETIPKCDVIFLKNIFHDWSDEKCLEMMKNFNQVLSKGNLLLSINYELPEACDTSKTWWNFSMDLAMLCLFGGAARERTITEFENLHKQAGFKIKRTVKLGLTNRPAVLIIASKE